MRGSLPAAWLVCAALLLPAITTADGELRTGGQGSVGDGAAITPAFAQALYDRLAPVRESDGCRLARFDTSRFRVAIGLVAPSGATYTVEIAAAPQSDDRQRRAGDWALAVPPGLERDCAPSLAAMERVLLATAAPRGMEWRTSGLTVVSRNYDVLAATFVLLIVGTGRVLYREAKAQRPSRYAVLALLLVWGAALALRLVLSPSTFLHEYYHIAETLSGYLIDGTAPVYGQTGPAVFRLVDALLGQRHDVQIIFVTNAVLSSLAIPALALLDLTLMGSWPRAICAAVLLSVLPQHLRFSAAEDLFVQAVTFGIWTLGLFALYVRTRRLDDALLAALALSLAMQTRPEMMFFPAVVVALLLCAEVPAWRIVFAWRTLVALLLLASLLVPRCIELSRALRDTSPPAALLPDVHRYLHSLVLFQSQVTPPVYWALLVVGLAWGVWQRSGVVLWVVLVFVGYTLLPLSLFNNPPWNLRSQLLPTSLVLLIVAGTASAWIALWGRYRRAATAIGASALAGFAAAVVVRSHGFVTMLGDQQLEWAFLERTVPRLPERATLLSAVEFGGRNLDAFPDFLLHRADKTYQMIDVRRAANGGVAWPPPGPDVLYYQGMYCYFAFQDEPSPDPMTAPCQAVHARYVTETLFVEDIDAHGYSGLRYAAGGQGPFRIGFFRLKAAR